MGYTHFNRVSSTSGYSVGAKGSESAIIDSSGNITTAGTITATGAITVGTVVQSSSQGVMHFVFAGASTAIDTQWSVMPYNCNAAGYATLSVSSGTGRMITVEHGSAGDVALSLSAATVGVTGTIGKVMTLVAGTVNFTAGECFRVVQVSCATAQVSGVTLILTKT